LISTPMVDTIIIAVTENQMEITWYGHSCFRLTERGMATVVTDPFDVDTVGFEPPRLKADIVTSSHDVPGHNNLGMVRGYSHAIMGPGEFEIGGVFITGIQTDVSARKGEEERTRNSLFVFDYLGITVAHLGDLRSVPTQSEIEALGNVNVALVPVGGGNGLNAAKAAEVVSLLEPNFVIPMHYYSAEANVPLEKLDKFLKEMGLHEAESMPTLKVSRSGLPEETRVVVLEVQRETAAGNNSTKNL
jgi:L-ascorbate metabolism protein UlaG (beta-lactamase superfamily)